MTQKIRLIGLDPGASAVRAGEAREGEVATACVASVVGVGATDTGALSLAGVGRGGRRGPLPDRVAFDGVEYLVGENVTEYAKPIERIDFARFTDGPELRSLMYLALDRLLGSTGRKSETIALVVGMPVELLEDTEQAAQVGRGMRKWLVGRHRFAVNGEERRLEVVEIKTTIAQPAGTWFDWGLDTSGQWARGAQAMKAPTLIIDEGFSTLDVFAVNAGRVSRRNTDGALLGTRRACEMIGESIGRRYRIEVGLHEADELIQHVAVGKKARVYVAGELMDVTPEVNQALNTIGTDVVRFLERAVDGGRRFKVLLTGGGALALAGRLTRQLGHAEMMPEPRLANVRGLAKLAQRAGFLVKDEH